MGRPSIRPSGCARADSFAAFNCNGTSLPADLVFSCSNARTIPIFRCMTIVQMLIGRTRSMLRKAGVLLAATQIMLGTAPLTESETRSARAHVEAGGVDLHHAHNEETCIACVAFKVFGTAEPSDRAPTAEPSESGVAPASSRSFDPRLASGPPRSRAPPEILG